MWWTADCWCTLPSHTWTVWFFSLDIYFTSILLTSEFAAPKGQLLAKKNARWLYCLPWHDEHYYHEISVTISALCNYDDINEYFWFVYSLIFWQHTDSLYKLLNQFYRIGLKENSFIAKMRTLFPSICDYLCGSWRWHFHFIHTPSIHTLRGDCSNSILFHTCSCTAD
jgi:hypothetical protein